MLNCMPANNVMKCLMIEYLMYVSCMLINSVEKSYCAMHWITDDQCFKQCCIMRMVCL